MPPPFCALPPHHTNYLTFYLLSSIVSAVVTTSPFHSSLGFGLCSLVDVYSTVTKYQTRQTACSVNTQLCIFTVSQIIIKKISYNHLCLTAVPRFSKLQSCPHRPIRTRTQSAQRAASATTSSAQGTLAKRGYSTMWLSPQLPRPLRAALGKPPQAADKACSLNNRTPNPDRNTPLDSFRFWAEVPGDRIDLHPRKQDFLQFVAALRPGRRDLIGLRWASLHP